MKKLILTLSILIMLTGISCKKYKNGPKITFRTAKGRLCRTWTVGAINKDGFIMSKWQDDKVAYRQTLNNVILAFNTDNTFTMKISYEDYGNTETGSVNGSWEFSSDKETIIITSNGKNIANLSILKLTASELWIDSDYTMKMYGYDFEAHLTEKK